MLCVLSLFLRAYFKVKFKCLSISVIVLHVLEQRLNFLNFKTKLGHLSFHVAVNSIVEVWVFRSIL